jgi:hypothetical protein
LLVVVEVDIIMELVVVQEVIENHLELLLVVIQ